MPTEGATQGLGSLILPWSLTLADAWWPPPGGQGPSGKNNKDPPTPIPGRGQRLRTHHPPGCFSLSEGETAAAGDLLPARAHSLASPSTVITSDSPGESGPQRQMLLFVLAPPPLLHSLSSFSSFLTLNFVETENIYYFLPRRQVISQNPNKYVTQ